MYRPLSLVSLAHFLSDLVTQRTARESIWRHALLNVTASALARFISFATLPVVTAIYTPDQLGVWAIVSSISYLFLAITTLRYDLAIVIASTKRIAAALVCLMQGFAVLVSLLLLILSLIMPQSMLDTVTGLKIEHRSIVWAIPPLLIALSSQLLIQAWLMRYRDFFAISLANIVQSVVTVGLTVVAPLFFEPSATLLIFAALLGVITSIAVQVKFASQSLLGVVRTEFANAALIGLRRYSVYPRYALAIALSASLAERVLQLGLANTYSVASLGTYYVARQLMMAPVTLFTNAVSQVVFGHGQAWRANDILESRVSALHSILLSFLAPIVAFFAIWLEPIIDSTFDRNWEQLGQFAWWCIWPAAGLLISAPFTRVADIQRRQRIGSSYQVASNAVLILCFFAFSFLTEDALSFVAAVAIPTMLAHIGWMLVALYLAGVPLCTTLTGVARATAIGAVLAGLHMAIQHFIPNPLGLATAFLLLLISLALPAIRIFELMKKTS